MFLGVRISYTNRWNDSNKLTFFSELYKIFIFLFGEFHGYLARLLNILQYNIKKQNNRVPLVITYP